MMKKNYFARYTLSYNLYWNWLITFLIFLLLDNPVQSQVITPVPPEYRGNIDYERIGHHDANLIRTRYRNYGMVGDYPDDPINVDLSIFHSVEIPKGSGENYSDGTTPFVLSKVTQTNGNVAYIMETGYRERQGTSPYTNKTMRFEPRPGYFEPSNSINLAEAPAISTDSRTWPAQWYDKQLDPDDPGWSGSWNGYFGKAPKADQESFTVVDDNFYDAWSYYPDDRDNTRRGLALRVEQRGFQWSNPQAAYVIFFHYDITNEGTTSYDDNVIFGLYMDSGVGGSAIGLDGIPESDDDNAYYDLEAGLNLVYTWDKNGNGVKGPTGYLGYSYLETPGNSIDAVDNDMDGILNEKRNSGPGTEIIGQEQILSYVNANYDMVKFDEYFGSVESRPAYIAGVWWTGDEELDWVAEYYDTGADGIFGTNDTGELDGQPTNGETNFDKTDIDESDQIGLTGFKLNRIRPGYGNPSTEVDQIVFFDDGKQWPKRLWNIFTSPDSAFGQPLALNYNIGFLFASGPFVLSAQSTERFSLALGFGSNLRELRVTTAVVQQIYKANYQFAVPPPLPTLTAYAGDGFVQLDWSNASERAFDPITNNNDFEGYRIYRSTDPSFLDSRENFPGNGEWSIVNGYPIAQFDLVNNIYGYSQTTVNGIAYFLGGETGLTHTYKDTTVNNGQRYYYAVCSYDRGVDSIQIYPSENAITISQSLRGGTILPSNAVEVYPNPPVVGYTGAEASSLVHSEGIGTGEVQLRVINNEVVPDDHLMLLSFTGSEDSVRAEHYMLQDQTEGDTLFLFGDDLEGLGTGPVGNGILPVISTIMTVELDSVNTLMVNNSNTNIPIVVRYSPAFPINLRRVGYPNNINVIFSDVIIDTSVAGVGLPSRPVKFTVRALTDSGEIKMPFRYYDADTSLSSTLDANQDYIEVLTATKDEPNIRKATWKFQVDTANFGGGQIIPPTLGDVYELRLFIPYGLEDKFTFMSKAGYVDQSLAQSQFDEDPYVVPNPYTGAASFEPQRYAVSGRGERKIEFRNLPANCTIRIYTISGELVQTLTHDGNINYGVVAWDLRNRDNLDIAPGLYIYHVDGGSVGTFIGKFAVIK
jgi:hypothetical protein